MTVGPTWERGCFFNLLGSPDSSAASVPASDAATYNAHGTGTVRLRNPFFGMKATNARVYQNK
jgi:hypothetical protein